MIPAEPMHAYACRHPIEDGVDALPERQVVSTWGRLHDLERAAVAGRRAGACHARFASPASRQTRGTFRAALAGLAVGDGNGCDPVVTFGFAEGY